MTAAHSKILKKSIFRLTARTLLKIQQEKKLTLYRYLTVALDFSLSLFDKVALLKLNKQPKTTEYIKMHNLISRKIKN